MLRLLLEDEHRLDFETGVLEFVLRCDDVADLVLVDDPSDFGGGVGVVVDGDEPVQRGDHEVAVNHFEEVDHGFGLVLGGAHFEEVAEGKGFEVDFYDGGDGLVVVPGEYQHSGYLLASRIPHSKYF
mgnify:FL=1